MLLDNATVLRDVDSLVFILFVMSCVFVDVPFGRRKIEKIKMGIHTRECFLLIEAKQQQAKNQEEWCLSNSIQSIGSDSYNVPVEFYGKTVSVVTLS